MQRGLRISLDGALRVECDACRTSEHAADAPYDEYLETVKSFVAEHATCVVPARREAAATA